MHQKSFDYGACNQKPTRHSQVKREKKKEEILFDATAIINCFLKLFKTNRS
jgi:hypothetical protein